MREVAGTSHRLPSGPLHDAAEVSRAGVPTAMLFVQSLRGLSHTKLEDTKPEHLELAVQALDRLATKTLAWASAVERTRCWDLHCDSRTLDAWSSAAPAVRRTPEIARFCLACAAPLAARRPTSQDMRKTITVVFADVVGSTALGEQLDAESLRVVIGRYFEEMSAVIERHGGKVEKFIGDAVMAVFGIPVVHEDDALRAVRAAVEMRDALAT